MEDPTRKDDPIARARREISTDPLDPIADDTDTTFSRRGQWPNPDVERAQPGDVLGIERDGETTEIGDTAEDEDERRRDALKKG